MERRAARPRRCRGGRDPVRAGIHPPAEARPHGPRELEPGSALRHRSRALDAGTRLAARRRGRRRPALGAHAPAHADRRRRTSAASARRAGPADRVPDPGRRDPLHRSPLHRSCDRRPARHAHGRARDLGGRDGDLARARALRRGTEPPLAPLVRACELRPRRLPRLGPADRSSRARAALGEGSRRGRGLPLHLRPGHVRRAVPQPHPALPGIRPPRARAVRAHAARGPAVRGLADELPSSS